MRVQHYHFAFDHLQRLLDDVETTADLNILQIFRGLQAPRVSSTPLRLPQLKLHHLPLFFTLVTTFIPRQLMPFFSSPDSILHRFGFFITKNETLLNAFNLVPLSSSSPLLAALPFFVRVVIEQGHIVQKEQLYRPGRTLRFEQPYSQAQL